VSPTRSASGAKRSGDPARMMAGVKPVRLVSLTAAGLLGFAAPAGASTPIVASHMWYYWLAPILTVSAAGLVLSVWGGYIRKVLFPKYRGRKVQD
jgi:hypothetical protein